MFNTRSISSEVENTNNDFDSSIVENLATQSNFVLVEEEKSFDNIISHNLAHALIDQEPETFLLIYDKIPSELSQTRVSSNIFKSLFQRTLTYMSKNFPIKKNYRKCTCL